MVNTKTHNETKKKILDLLRNSSIPISGEELGRELGFSRVALWKHIAALKDAGYEIESSSKGYSIGHSEDYLYPWEFPEFTENIIHYETVSTTMEIALATALNGNADGKIIVAETQSSGRGSRERQWVSDNGGLFFTCISQKERPLAFYREEELKIAVILYDLLYELYGDRVSLKWPNDILFDNKKIGGILSESFASGDKTRFVNVGVGINVNNELQLDSATSLKESTGQIWSRRDLLHRFLVKYRDYSPGVGESAAEFMSRWCGMGQMYRVTTGGVLLKGTAVGINRHGNLLLSSENGVDEISPGERE